MKLPSKAKDRETILDIVMEVLEKRIGKGDREKMLNEVEIFARAYPKDYYKLLVALQPKNVKMEVEGKLMYVSLGAKKEEIPADLPVFNEWDSVIANEPEGEAIN